MTSNTDDLHDVCSLRRDSGRRLLTILLDLWARWVRVGLTPFCIFASRLTPLKKYCHGLRRRPAISKSNGMRQLGHPIFAAVTAVTKVNGCFGRRRCTSNL